MLMMMVRNHDDDDDDDDDGDDDDGEEARSKAMHESAFRSDAWRRVPKRGPYQYGCICLSPVIIWLVVSTPLKNISQLGLLFPIYGK